jgi:hypothetical protein
MFRGASDGRNYGTGTFRSSPGGRGEHSAELRKHMFSLVYFYANKKPCRKLRQGFSIRKPRGELLAH